ncbi:hypothetical protein M3P05_15380 [Sansalvadorimonas sp. 2012CJ34-2]|uniref:Uncharacterized protein n=1 Tax=Parendozoicomonas callyspongiae TaxID=2942213 RepID=A0ABT0PIX3_9GAMM|nr:hypothetical protein [Sansalvadorimonas sp. 2012CJ34-2]MCL6271305.1 hypothetical protein [Sansalvadorimonas sp. 2012CJ34-2]
MNNYPDTAEFQQQQMPETTDTSEIMESYQEPAITGPLILDETLAEKLPHSHQIYTRLREGVHLSVDSPDQFPLYKELEQHRDSYTALFSLLGYELIYHPDGFFYFTYPDSTTSQSLTMSRKVALLIFTLIDFLQDNNYDPAATITGEKIALQLLDDTRRHFADLYQQAELSSYDSVSNLLEWMARRGMCLITDEDHIRFLKPINRFLAAAEQVTADAEQAQEMNQEQAQKQADEAVMEDEE